MSLPLILVVDDQPFVAEVTAMVLKHAGLRVLIATTASEAETIWQNKKDEISLLVADFELDSNRTGEELAEQFEQEKPGLKSIILSAYPLDQRFRARKEGVDYFQKPWDCKAVIASVKKHLALEVAA